MLNLMIVDDEELIREEIKSKITRISHPAIGNIMLAADGIEAKRFLREYKPEIVISDIRMPGMDGLTLIRECSQTNPDVKFIVLSGHGDYGYVREAFKYGIVDYLLKPVRLSELEMQLNKAILQYTTDTSKQSSTAIANSFANESRQWLNRIVSGDDLDPQLVNKLNDTYSETSWRICRFLYDNRDAVDSQTEDKIQEFFNTLLSINGESKTITPIILRTDRDGGILAINHSESISTEILKLNLHALVEQLSQVTGARIMAALSDARSLSNVKDADRKAVNLLSYRILHEGSFVLDENEGKGKEKRLPVDKKEIEQLMEHLRQLNLDEARQGIVDWFQTTRLRAIDSAYIRQMYLMILSEISRWHSDKLPEEMISSEDEFNRHHSLNNIRIHLFNQLSAIDPGVRQTGVRSRTAIGIVKQYIEEHPDGDVTLADVSNLVAMSYTYFSSWFKMETGLTFSAYVTRQRMEKAKRVLEDPTVRINEVANLVGYENIYHFSRAFKNYTGMSPKEYRKSADDI
ncbi:response regulator transcription factor [Paenibacillus sp. YIM B09110]|uniref:response regulator transcription factor n=1 Tax=Paenibacillus sp. YIM B09110 TaxID=3126102 RepID=UPI00301C0519